jgi:putative salt-induced outer membrane protein
VRSLSAVFLAAVIANYLGAQAVAPKTSFSGDLGFVSASGNTRLTTLNVGEKLIHTDERWTLSQLGTYIYGETKGVETANQLRFAGRADYVLHPRLAVFAGASFERNRFAGFDSRTDEVAGLSWKALTEAHDSLSLDAGGVLTQESDVDGTHKDFPSARVAGAYKHSFSKTTYFQQLGEYLRSLDGGGGYRVNTETAIVAPLSAHIGIKVGYVVRFNSKPPTNFGTTDRLLTTGIQISY